MFFFFAESKTEAKSGFLDLFFSQLIFIMLLVSFYAIINARLNTIFLLLPGLLFFVARKMPFSLKHRLTINSVKWLFAPILLTILIGICNYFIILPKSIEKDVIYYSKIASYLRDFGKENFYHFYNTLFETKVGLTPYHYTELWLTAFGSGIFKIQSVLVLKYIVYPYLLSIGLIGVIGLIEVLAKRKADLFLLLFIFVAVLFLTFLGSLFSIKSSGWDIVFSPWLRPNFLLYILAAVPVVYALHLNDYKLLMLFFLLACFLSFTLIPAVVISALLLLLYLVATKEMAFKDSLICAAILAFGLICYYGFYFVNKSNVRLNGSRTTLEIVMYSFSIWKATLMAYINLSVRFVLFLPVFYLFVKKGIFKKNMVVYLYLLILSSLGTFQLLSQMDNSYQIPHLGFVLFAVVALISLGYYFLRISNNLVKLSIICCLVVIEAFMKTNSWRFGENAGTIEEFYVSKSGMGIDFSRQVVQQMKNKNDLFGFFLDKEQIHEKEFRYLTELTLQPTLGLSYLTDCGNTVSINNKNDIFKYSRGRGKEIIEFWYSDMFKSYCCSENPMQYITSNKIKGFFITKNGILEQQIDVNESGIKYIEDRQSDWVLIYR